MCPPFPIHPPILFPIIETFDAQFDWSLFIDQMLQLQHRIGTVRNRFIIELHHDRQLLTFHSAIVMATTSTLQTLAIDVTEVLKDLKSFLGESCSTMIPIAPAKTASLSFVRGY